MIRTSVQKMMREWNMISSGDKLLAAVSGGADSVCLLLMLRDLQESMDFSLEAIHVEHGIRGEESLQDQRFVQRLCDLLDVPLTCVSVDVPAYREEAGLSEEEAARELRYGQFASVAMKKNAKVVLAHHMEDNAETMLFQMARGSRLTGLCGIRPVRKDENGVIYLRPMLEVHREEIEQELKRRGQHFCVDSTNKELEYSRNYLRGEVLPRICKLNDQAVRHMNELAKNIWNVQDFLEQETSKAWELLVKESLFDDGRKNVTVQIEELQKFHMVIQTELIKRMIVYVAGSGKDITSGHVENVMGLCGKQSGKEVHLPYQVIGRRDFDKLVIERAQLSDLGNIEEGALQKGQEELYISEEDLTMALQNEEAFSVALKDGREKLKIKVFRYAPEDMEIPKKRYTKWLDYDKIKQGFRIRTRQNGDYFVSDVMGHRKKLQNYFVDEKITVEQRERMWLIAQNSYVLWLIGGRISENLKVTENTKVVVELEYIGG